MSNELEGTWTIETSGGLTECLFPLQRKILIQPSEKDPERLDVILVEGDLFLLMGNVSKEGDGEVTLRLQVRVIDPVLQLLRLNTTTQNVSPILEESPVGSWTAEEGGGDVEG